MRATVYDCVIFLVEQAVIGAIEPRLCSSGFSSIRHPFFIETLHYNQHNQKPAIQES